MKISASLFVGFLAALSMAIDVPMARAVTPAEAASVTGRYSMPGNATMYFDLRPDGTFTAYQAAHSTSGTYAVKGTEVALTAPGFPPDPVHIVNGVLVGPDGTKMPKTGPAGAPPTAGQLAANASALAAVDPINRLKSMNNVKQLCVACMVWASDHQGQYPDTLEQLLTPKYAGANPAILHCPLLNDDKQAGYLYFGKGRRDKEMSDGILILSRWQDAQKQRIVGHGDGSVVVEAPKPEKLPESARAAIIAAASANGAPGVAPQLPAPAPSTATAKGDPTALAKITLSKNENGKGRYGAIFPMEQMPANTEGYFWVTDRPDNTSNVTALQQRNTWWVALVPGVYKVRVEYRGGTSRKVVSNVLDVTVPGTKP